MKIPPPVSIRLDAETERRLRRIAHEDGSSLSAVVREAIAEYGAARERRAATAPSAYERLAPFVGVVGRETGRSERTGERFRAIVQARARARRAR